jgi:uncharacterized membrane protein YdjX (TVP38/TMEM64 family)
MRKKKKRKLKKILLPAITIVLFVIISYLSQRYAKGLTDLISIHSTTSAIIYVLIMVAAVIVAPFETLPLLPVAATVWGPNIAAILTSVGWTVGSLVAFFLARKFGKRFVHRITDKYHLKEWGEVIPKRNIFWLVAFARFFLPIDVISYAVGLFTKMRWSSYLFATLTGVIPFAFIFAHGSQLKLGIQISIALLFFVLVLFRYKKIKEFFRTWSKEINKSN